MNVMRIILISSIAVSLLFLLVNGISYSQEVSAQNWSAWAVAEGAALREQGNYSEAIASFDKALELNPRNLDAWLNKAYTSFLQGDYENAEVAYDYAIAINLDRRPGEYIDNSSQSDAYIGKANCELNQASSAIYNASVAYSSAILAANEAIRYDPENKFAWLSLGEANWGLGELTQLLSLLLEAKSDFNHVLELDPNYYAAIEDLAALDLRLTELGYNVSASPLDY